jgi:hypothetical protein
MPPSVISEKGAHPRCSGPITPLNPGAPPRWALPECPETRIEQGFLINIGLTAESYQWSKSAKMDVILAASRGVMIEHPYWIDSE